MVKLEPEEMMIGNIVQDNKGNLLEVMGFNEKTITFYVIDRSKFPLEDGWFAVSIYLNEKWIDAFRIKKVPDSEYTLNTYDFLGFKLWYKDGIFLYYDRIIINSEHQLQNLYFSLSKKQLKLWSN